VSLFLLLLALSADPCTHGGGGAQCVTCVPSDRGTFVCRGLCYTKTKKDGGYDSVSLKTEANDEHRARLKMDEAAKEKCR
jgi:hypothetical protein